MFCKHWVSKCVAQLLDVSKKMLVVDGILKYCRARYIDP